VQIAGDQSGQLSWRELPLATQAFLSISTPTYREVLDDAECTAGAVLGVVIEAIYVQSWATTAGLGVDM